MMAILFILAIPCVAFLVMNNYHNNKHRAIKYRGTTLRESSYNKTIRQSQEILSKYKKQ